MIHFKQSFSLRICVGYMIDVMHTKSSKIYYYFDKDENLVIGINDYEYK